MSIALRSAAVLCMVLVLAACGDPVADEVPSEPVTTDPQPDDGDTAIDDDGVASEDESASDDQEGSDADSDQAGDDGADADDEDGSDADDEATEDGPQVMVFFARDAGTRLTLEPVTITLPAPTEAIAAGAIEQILAGTSRSGLVTFAPSGTTLLDATIADGLLTVDLSGEVRENPGSGGAGEEAFAQQLALTGAQFDTVEAVQLLVEGEAVEELWGHLSWEDPISADPYAITPIVVESPATPAEVPVGTTTISGHALVFEGTIVMTVTAPDGSATEDFFTAADGERTDFPTTDAEGMEVMLRQDWSVDVQLDEPGEWTVTLSETDPSDGEGRPPYNVDLVLTATE